MSLEDKLKLFKEKGYTYNPETGYVKNKNGRILTRIDSRGYIILATTLFEKCIQCSVHQFAWYVTYNEVPSMIDHIDINKLNNKISNLRITNQQKNQFNRLPKGYYFNKNERKYQATICISAKKISLGYYKTPEEAHQAYLDAKKIYHII